ncbi:MAG: hypothetical protein LBK25_05235 [Treponema sp.]|jgi:hypothetical protein|nr:hypothetical protein [Treponema sp.]
MSGASWLPRGEQDFFDLCQKWKNGLNNPANVAAFGWDQAEVTAVLTALIAFLTARVAYKEDNSTKNRLIKDEARVAAEAAMRNFANSAVRFNKLMRDEDRLSYGLYPHDGSHTPDVEPTTLPEAKSDTSIIRQITIHFWDSSSKKRGKPHGIHGAEIRWALLDHVPASVDELTNSDFDTASPFTLKFHEDKRGRRVYFCLRWESNTNLKGPYGEIYSAVIP